MPRAWSCSYDLQGLTPTTHLCSSSSRVTMHNPRHKRGPLTPCMCPVDSRIAINVPMLHQFLHSLFRACQHAFLAQLTHLTISYHVFVMATHSQVQVPSPAVQVCWPSIIFFSFATARFLQLERPPAARHLLLPHAATIAVPHQLQRVSFPTHTSSSYYLPAHTTSHGKATQARL